MEQEKKLTHIRTLQENDYFGEWDLPQTNNGSKVVTIVKVEIGEVIGNGNRKSQKPLVYFKEHKKPLVLNATNRKAIRKVLESPFIEDWIGKQIELYRLCGVRAFGDTVDAVRVKTTKPTPPQKPQLTQTHEKFNPVCEAVKSGKSTITDIEKYFILSSEVKQILTNLIPKQHERI